MDYILTPERWKHKVKDAEADHTPNIPTNHYPVRAIIRIILNSVQIAETKENIQRTK